MKILQFGSRFGLLQAGLMNINSLDTLLKKVSSANSPPKTVFQLVALSPLVSEKQVLVGIEQACSAFDSKTAISNRLEFELLVRLAGKRQIKDALELLSPKEGLRRDVVLIGVGTDKPGLKKETQKLGQSLGLNKKTNLFETNFKKNKMYILKSFDVSPQQIASFENWKEKDVVEALVLEKMALVALES